MPSNKVRIGLAEVESLLFSLRHAQWCVQGSHREDFRRQESVVLKCQSVLKYGQNQKGMMYIFSQELTFI